MNAADHLTPGLQADLNEQLQRRGVLDTPEAPPVCCAWCDKEQGIVRLLSSGLSHGICPRHRAMLDEQVNSLQP